MLLLLLLLLLLLVRLYVADTDAIVSVYHVMLINSLIYRTNPLLACGAVPSVNLDLFPNTFYRRKRDAAEHVDKMVEADKEEIEEIVAEQDDEAQADKAKKVEVNTDEKDTNIAHTKIVENEEVGESMKLEFEAQKKMEVEYLVEIFKHIDKKRK